MHQRRNNEWHPLLVKLMEFSVRSPKLARKLIKEHPYALELRTGIRETAMHYLAVENYPEAVSLLIELGADPNTKNEFGHSALEEAISVNATETVEVLKTAGAA